MPDAVPEAVPEAATLAVPEAATEAVPDAAPLAVASPPRPRSAPRLRCAGLAALACALGASCASSPGLQVLARGVLPYGVATTGDTVVTIELSERFELVVREEGAAQRRLELGPAEHDLRALAVFGDRAFVGSDAGFIRELDLTSLREVTSYAVGAPLLALAADADFLLSADASGAVCLRRRKDGALLQCARSEQPVHAITLLPEGRAQLVSGSGAAVTWRVPSLTLDPAPGPADGHAADTPFRDGEVHAEGRRLLWRRGGRVRVLAELATEVRGVARTRSGALVVAAWPRSLDDAVLLMIRQ